VKLVLSCCILHNWILGWGEDDFLENVVTFDEVETGHSVETGDTEAWKKKMFEWAKCGKSDARPPCEKEKK
jgi:hypothetical protein